MDFLTWFIVLFELGIIIFLGNVVGKIMHAAIVRTIRFVTKRTKLTLDDYLIQYVENPLRLSIIVLSVLIMSGIIPNLMVVQTVLLSYGVAILIILIAYTLSEAVGAVLRWYYEVSKTRQSQALDLTLLPFIRKVTRIVFITVGSVIALSTIGVDISGLLAITSVGVLILGLASQESLANIFAGLVLQLDRPAAYGDYVRTLNGDILRLNKIGGRSAKFQDLDGNLVVMSNSELAKQRLTNLSNLRTGFHTTLTAEIPHRIPVAEVEKRLEELFRKESMKKTATRANPILVERIAKDGYLISIPLAVKDADNFIAVRDTVNRALADMLQGKS